MQNLLPANRVAAIAAFLTGLASALAGLESALPTAGANAVVTAVGVLGAVGTALHFMTGSQKHDALVTPLPEQAASAVEVALTTPPAGDYGEHGYAPAHTLAPEPEA